MDFLEKKWAFCLASINERTNIHRPHPSNNKEEFSYVFACLHGPWSLLLREACPIVGPTLEHSY